MVRLEVEIQEDGDAVVNGNREQGTGNGEQKTGTEKVLFPVARSLFP
jgi:hypothetical protein